MQMQQVLGFMSGTSLDGIDMAILRTDGERIEHFGPSGEAPLPDGVRALVQEAIVAGRSWGRSTPEPEVFAEASRAIAEAHALAAAGFLRDHAMGFADIDLIGFHGQTVLHEPPTATAIGRTRQLGDAALLASLTGVPIAYDFRTTDVAAGGQGAPLVPVYHAALAGLSGIKAPVAVLNIGGVANLTFISDTGELLAFDTGPGNGPLDQWVESHGLGRYDAGGALSLSGQVNEAVLTQMMGHGFFTQTGPKSLDRYDFTADSVKGLSPEDGAATLAAFVAQSVAHGLSQAPQPPRALMVCGGGRYNGAILSGLRQRSGLEVMTAEDAGWRGDAVEAEAFAFLAARVVRGLPISVPGTTGVLKPLIGGQVVDP
jgi:anhydro-N-acetylmuramic acid kinase